MKQRKWTSKIWTALVCLALLVSLASCGTDTSGGTDTSSGTETSGGTETSDGNNAGEAETNTGNDQEETQDFTGQTVRVTAWGGSYEETLRNIVKPAFEEKTGATLEIVLGEAPVTQLKNEGDDPSVDVMHFGYYDFQTAKMMDVLMPLNFSEMPNAADLYDKAKEDEYGVISNWGSWGFAYRKDLIEEPTSWADLWKPEYAGKVVIDDFPGGVYEISEMIARTFCDGKSLEDRSTWDTVFEKLEELAPNLYMLSPQHNYTENALVTGDAVIAQHPNGRAARLILDGAENIGFTSLEEGVPGMPTFIGIAKNTHVPELALALVNELISVEVELAYAENNYYAPSNRKCVVPEEIQSLMPYGEELVEKLVYFDQEKFTVEERAEFIDRWNKALKNA